MCFFCVYSQVSVFQLLHFREKNFAQSLPRWSKLRGFPDLRMPPSPYTKYRNFYISHIPCSVKCGMFLCVCVWVWCVCVLWCVLCVHVRMCACDIYFTYVCVVCACMVVCVHVCDVTCVVHVYGVRMMCGVCGVVCNVYGSVCSELYRVIIF